MQYIIKKHGDMLEKEAYSFIEQKFQNYESVWQIFIGNTGNAIMASLPNYDETKRANFAENSYTVLESFFVLHKILESNIFSKEIKTFEEYLDYSKSYITFFAYLGRIHDTVIKASSVFKYNNSNFLSKIHRFYESRNIIIHGKKIPFIFDDLGLVKVPTLHISEAKGINWNDSGNNWKDISNMNSNYISDITTNLFEELLEIINNEYAVFLNLIHEDLKKLNTSLVFEYDENIIPKNKSILITSISGSSVSELSEIKPEMIFGKK
jgi:hypothetical protein